MIALVIAAQLASGGCASASCGNPCTSCAWQPVDGTDPDVAGWMSLFEDVSTRTVDADWPTIDPVNAGPARDPVAAEFPCRLLPAIGAVESGIKQFCSGVTVISFDCGFGVTQVTSGAANYPGIESRADINVAAGADILVAKWNGAGSFGGPIGDSDPSFVESWYFAVWAYNGFGYYNNPNNPDFPANRPPFNGPGQLSRGSYPYQELEWGYLRNPLVKDGAPMWEPLEVTYPDNADVPDVAGLFDTGMPLPTPAHQDPCVEECPPAGCPPDDARELVLDDLDALFSIVGDSTEHAEGGFRDHFRSLAVAPADAPSATARWEGTAPSSGTFDVGMFIPLDPATCEDVRVQVTARGGVTVLTQNQNVSGGFFQTLGQVALLAGEDVVVEVTNASSDADAAHRIGVDALRFVWRGDGDVIEGDACATSAECAADLICVNGACAVGCEASACSEGSSCTRATGLCADPVGEGEGEGEGGEGEGEGQGGEGEGEGEGSGDGRTVGTPGGCTCATGGGSDALVVALALGLIRRRASR